MRGSVPNEQNATFANAFCAVQISITRFRNRGLTNLRRGWLETKDPVDQTVELVHNNVSGHSCHTLQQLTWFQPIILVHRLICASMMATTDELVPEIIVGIDFGMTCTGQQAKLSEAMMDFSSYIWLIT